MRKYEVMYILKADLEDAKRQEVIDSMHAIITNENGTVDKVDEWGVRDFAYEIDHMSKGYYVVINVTCESDTIKEFDRLMRINQNVVRHMIINEDEKK